jgi:hypothetical protein
MMHSRRTILSLLLLVLSTAASSAAPLATPGLDVVDAGYGKVVLDVSASVDGAPAGFTVLWMKKSDFLANGSQWYLSANGVQSEASFEGVPTLNTWGGTLQSFVLSANQTARVEIGDLYAETGVTATNRGELAVDTDYVFAVRLNGNVSAQASQLSPDANTSTLGDQNCTFTIGYWKNHPSAWPVASLTVGTVTYTQTQLLQILNQPVQGNGLVSLAHQLIATKLNIAYGASDAAIASTVAAADAQIGGLVIPPIGSGFIHPSQTSSKTQALDDYNNGITGPGHCPTLVRTSTWGTAKASYR